MTKIERRELITKGKLPLSAWGGKASIKEKLVITAIVIALIIFIVLMFVLR